MNAATTIIPYTALFSLAAKNNKDTILPKMFEVKDIRDLPKSTTHIYRNGRKVNSLEPSYMIGLRRSTCSCHQLLILQSAKPYLLNCWQASRSLLPCNRTHRQIASRGYRFLAGRGAKSIKLVNTSVTRPRGCCGPRNTPNEPLTRATAHAIEAYGYWSGGILYVA
uniref:Uncharacterized protein n=1 Tax=Glossina pallidipes TaxID=7398 RepID=A0A1A9ZZD5_GLOPL